MPIGIDEEQIKALYRDYWRCMIENDVEGLRNIMADDYYLLHMTGVKQSAEMFLQGLLDGIFNYYSAEHDGVAFSDLPDDFVCPRCKQPKAKFNRA